MECDGTVMSDMVLRSDQGSSRGDAIDYPGAETFKPSGTGSLRGCGQLLERTPGTDVTDVSSRAPNPDLT